MNKFKINILYVNKNKSFLKEIMKINKNVFYKDNLLNSIDTFFSKDINFIITEVNDFNDFNQLELFRVAKKNMPIIILNNKEVSIKLIYKLTSLEIKGFYLNTVEDKQILLKKIIEISNFYKEELNNQKFLSMLSNVMDSNKDIIFSIENEDILYANKRFFEFFQVETLKEFHSKFISLQNLILKNSLTEIYIDKNLTTHDFIEHLYSFKEEMRTIALNDKIKGDVKIFLIKISFIKDGYILFTLIDITDMAKKHSVLEHKAHVDALTKVYNRHKFNEVVKNIDLNIQRNYSICMIDIDFFKKINDIYGHDMGDIVLREIASLIRNNIRRTDIFARWGGEEFILLLPDTNYDIAIKIVDSLRKTIEKYEIEHVGTISVSIGVSHSSFGSDIEVVRNLADKALYVAKNNGRNRVEGSHIIKKLDE